MFPGSTTKTSEGTIASAATVYPKTDVVKVTGSTAIGNIVPSFGGGAAGGILFLIPVDGAVGLLDTGNIGLARTMAQNTVTVLIYHRGLAKWYPNSIA